MEIKQSILLLPILLSIALISTLFLCFGAELRALVDKYSLHGDTAYMHVTVSDFVIGMIAKTCVCGLMVFMLIIAVITLVEERPRNFIILDPIDVVIDSESQTLIQSNVDILKSMLAKDSSIKITLVSGKYDSAIKEVLPITNLILGTDSTREKIALWVVNYQSKIRACTVLSADKLDFNVINKVSIKKKTITPLNLDQIAMHLTRKLPDVQMDAHEAEYKSGEDSFAGKIINNNPNP